MKVPKILTIVDTIALYLLYLPIWGIFIIDIAFSSDPFLDRLANDLGAVFRVSALLVFAFSYLIIFVTMLCANKIEGKVSEFSFAIKLVMIPWHIMNFVFCLLLCIGFMAGWMMPLVPLFILWLFFLLIRSFFLPPCLRSSHS